MNPWDQIMAERMILKARESLDRATSQRANIARAVEAQEERKRLAVHRAAQLAAIAGRKSTEGPSQFGRAAITGQPAALSRPQSMVRDALRMGGCPHRALAQIADDDLAVARQLLTDEMEGRRE
jgi:Mg-chelatase subunit ChlI